MNSFSSFFFQFLSILMLGRCTLVHVGRSEGRTIKVKIRWCKGSGSRSSNTCGAAILTQAVTRTPATRVGNDLQFYFPPNNFLFFFCLRNLQGFWAGDKAEQHAHESPPSRQTWTHDIYFICSFIDWLIHLLIVVSLIKFISVHISMM